MLFFKPSLNAFVGSYLLLVFFCACNFQPRKPFDISAKNDWKVMSFPTKIKAENDYDAIIVGGGIGGLTCAAVLAKKNYKVLLLEQHSQVGGYCTSFTRGEFTFPVGAHDVSGVDNGAIKTLLDLLDVKKEDLFFLHTRTYFLDNKKITFTGQKGDVVQKLAAMFPDEEKALKAFFGQAACALSERGAHRKDPSKAQPIFEAWSSVSYQKKLDEFFVNPQLKKFLCSLLGYIGLKPEQANAGDALSACLSYFIYGGYYPKKGGLVFAEALKQAIQQYGGIVLTNTKIHEILVTDNKVTGVRAGDKIFKSPIVIANVNAKTTFTKLLGAGKIDSAFIAALNNLKMSVSDGAVHFGVDLDLSPLSSIVKDLDRHIGLIINSSADATMAPVGKASITVGVDACYIDVPQEGTAAYVNYKQRLINKAIAKAEKLIPGISKHIIVSSVVTPKTFEQFTSMPEGAIYAFDQSVGSKRPYFKTPIVGLYLASASTYPGAGVEAVVASGLICARDILKK